MHARGPHIPEEESAEAIAWARKRKIELLILEHDPLAHPEVAQNGRQRCYYCKQMLLKKAREALSARGRDDFCLCDGGNRDDLAAYRPGLCAVAEAGVRSPLAQAGMGKAQIHASAAASGLERPWQKARPCLLTRLAYGLAPSAPLLQRIAHCEAALSRLGADLGDFRLRLAPEPLLQLERLPEDSRAKLEHTLAAHGFAKASFLISDKISGFFDQRNS